MSIDGLMKAFLDLMPALRRYLALRGATPPQAEDILQDMSVKLATGGMGPVAEVRAYLYRMATNQLQLQRRTEGRRVQRESDWMEAQGSGPGEADRRPSTERSLIAREQVLILKGVLDRLPERTRTIFLRFRVEREPQKQIAQDLSISVSAVEKHLTRAYAEVAAARSSLDADKPVPRHLSQKGDAR